MNDTIIEEINEIDGLENLRIKLEEEKIELNERKEILEKKENDFLIEKNKVDEEKEELAKKIKIFNMRKESLEKKEHEYIEELKDLEAGRENLRKERIVMQEECDNNAQRIVEEIKNRNIELNSKLSELNKISIENEINKSQLENKNEEIKLLKSLNNDYKNKIDEFEINTKLDEIISLKETKVRLEKLEEENEVLRKENLDLKNINQDMNMRLNELETLNNSNELLKNRLNRREAEIHYLKKLEKSKGTGEDGSQKIFEEIINKQIEEDQEDKVKQYYKDSEFVDGFIEFCSKAGFIYDKTLIRGFISSLRSSKLTILKGFSGTGKSSLPDLFAKYLNAECVVVPVQPNWRTKQDIMGFYNYFTNKFIPTELTQTLLRANVSKDRIFLIVLDEMNLARVEYYFSEFNSKLWLDSEKRNIELFEGITNYSDGISKYIKDNKISIPDNVYFIGTINEDDSVSPISDKIFDRAQVIEFMQLPSSKSQGNLDKAAEDTNKTEYTSFRSFIRAQDNGQMLSIDLVDSVNAKTKELFNKVIGFRSLLQIKEFIRCFILAGGSEKEALDMQLVSKFVPKFKSVSSENDIEALEELIEYIKELFINKFKFSEKEAERLQIIIQLNEIIEMLGE